MQLSTGTLASHCHACWISLQAQGLRKTTHQSDKRPSISTMACRRSIRIIFAWSFICAPDTVVPTEAEAEDVVALTYSRHALSFAKKGLLCERYGKRTSGHPEGISLAPEQFMSVRGSFTSNFTQSRSRPCNKALKSPLSTSNGAAHKHCTLFNQGNLCCEETVWACSGFFHGLMHPAVCQKCIIRQ